MLDIRKVALSICFLLASALGSAEELPEVSPELYQVKLDLGEEVIYEMIGPKDNLGWSLAIADIIQTKAHYHLYTSEIYTVVSGVLEVTLDNTPCILQTGEVLRIPIGAVHSARTLSTSPSRILVSCVPAWTPEDHLFVEVKE